MIECSHWTKTVTYTSKVWNAYDVNTQANYNCCKQYFAVMLEWVVWDVRTGKINKLMKRKMNFFLSDYESNQRLQPTVHWLTKHWITHWATSNDSKRNNNYKLYCIEWKIYNRMKSLEYRLFFVLFFYFCFCSMCVATGYHSANSQQLRLLIALNGVSHS